MEVKPEAGAPAIQFDYFRDVDYEQKPNATIRIWLRPKSPPTGSGNDGRANLN